jgi:hypothetical protein
VGVISCFPALSQGDYKRQLHKMAIAAQRKQAVLLKLLEMTSRHLLLLLVGGHESSRLGWLSQQLTAAHAQLNGHVERVRARVNRCVDQTFDPMGGQPVGFRFPR